MPDRPFNVASYTSRELAADAGAGAPPGGAIPKNSCTKVYCARECWATRSYMGIIGAGVSRAALDAAGASFRPLKTALHDAGVHEVFNHALVYLLEG